MENVLRNDWADLLQDEFEKSYFNELGRFLEKEYETETIYPAKKNIYNALHLTSFKDTKVVILGQDPYHGPNQAHGLSFSVQPEVTPPPSVKNIYKELQSDLGCKIPNNGYLVKWAEQGVLLLNTVLTVREGKPDSHKGKGWETFTDEVIKTLNEREKPVVFMLWGKKAQAKEELITADHHYVIKSAHPSPFSAKRGFFGSEPFSKANQFLENIGSEPIDWQIPDI